MEVPQFLTTYNVTKYFLNNLPSKLYLGDVINPEYKEIEDDEENEFNEFYEEPRTISSGKFGEQWKLSEFLKLKETDSILPLNSDELVELCEESKYGDLKTQETVQNDEVRKAYEISGDRLELTTDCLEFLESIKSDIKFNLYEGKNISFVLNKLNVYTKGCHFSTHVDTPKDNMIGTLVLELPCKYTGG